MLGDDCRVTGCIRDSESSFVLERDFRENYVGGEIISGNLGVAVERRRRISFDCWEEGYGVETVGRWKERSLS